MPEGLGHNFTSTKCDIIILLSLSLSGSGHGSISSSSSGSRDLSICQLYNTLGCSKCDVGKNVGGRFVAAVLPHSCENACRHRLLHSRHKKAFSSPKKTCLHRSLLECRVPDFSMHKKQIPGMHPQALGFCLSRVELKETSAAFREFRCRLSAEHFFFFRNTRVLELGSLFLLKIFSLILWLDGQF